MLVSSSAKKSGNVIGVPVDRNLVQDGLLLVCKSCRHLRQEVSNQMNFVGCG